MPFSLRYYWGREVGSHLLLEVQIDSPVGTFSGKGKLGYRTSPFFVLSFNLACVAAPDPRFFIVDSQQIGKMRYCELYPCF